MLLQIQMRDFVCVSEDAKEFWLAALFIYFFTSEQNLYSL